jgi:hypothetical protein
MEDVEEDFASIPEMKKGPFHLQSAGASERNGDELFDSRLRGSAQIAQNL